MKLGQQLDANGLKITGLPTPTAASDVATKAYVDAAVSGLDVKASVRAASTANVNLAAPGATIDGVALNAGDRVLLKNQTTGSENGIWVWNGAGSAMTRAGDADANAEVTAGLFTWVTEGTANADTGWVLTTNDAIVVGTTALSFSQFNSAGSVSAGNGLTLTGSTLDVGAGNGITVAADTVAVDPAVVARKATATIGNGAAQTFTVTHNLNSSTVVVSVVEIATGTVWLVDWTVVDANSISVSFGFVPTNNQFRVSVLG